MKFLNDIDAFGNKGINVGAGTNPTDGVALSQVGAVTAGRLLGWFQVTVTQAQSYIAIPAAYQSKGMYLVMSDSVFIPPQYITFTAYSITVDTSTTGFFLTAGTVTVLVFS
jgi:hypothetical protein